MKMLWSIIGAACVLPLCAADAGDRSNLAFWLVMHHGAPILTTRTALCAVNKYISAESSKILDQCRTQIKTFVQEKYHIDHCQITYSPDRLSAAIVEKTGLESTYRGTMNKFIYIYVDDALKMKEVDNFYPQNERKTIHSPFFTPKYACLDFGTTNPDPPIGEGTGLCWNRSTKAESGACFSIICCDHRIPTEWFIKKLPHLYAKIMQTPKFFECDFSYSPSTFHKKILEQHGFSFDLAKADILTPKDLKIVSNFVPGGKDAKWCEVKQEKNRYLLFNLIACYGKDTKLLKLIDQHVGKQTIKSSSDWRTFVVSTCRDIVVCNRQHESPGNRCTITDRYDPHFSAVGQATLNYMQQLKKENVFVEKNWKSNKPMPLTKRIKKMQQALSFLKRERMTFIKQNDQLIRYDVLNKCTVAVFTDNTFRTSGILEKQLHTIPKNIDPKSLKIATDRQIEYKTI